MVSMQYLLMAKISLSTIYQTIFLALLLLIAKGWTIVRNSLSRNEATGVTMLMAAVYLTDSAYYVSGSMAAIEIFVEVLLIIMYLVLLFIITRLCIFNIRILKIQLNLMRENGVTILVPAVKQKLLIMAEYMVVAVCYFLFEIIVHGIIQFAVQQTEDVQRFIMIFHEMFDFFVIFMLLLILRAKKYAAYFSLSLLESQAFGNQVDNEDEDRRIIAPLLTVTVPEHMLGSYTLSGPDIQNLNPQDSQPILLVNPFDGESKPNDSIEVEGICDSLMFAYKEKPEPRRP